MNNGKEIEFKSHKEKMVKNILTDFGVPSYKVGELIQSHKKLKFAIRDFIKLMPLQKIILRWNIIVIRLTIKYYLKYYLCFGWYLTYITKKKFSFKKMNIFEDWIYYRYIAKDFQRFTERET